MNQPTGPWKYRQPPVPAPPTSPTVPIPMLPVPGTTPYGPAAGGLPQSAMRTAHADRERAVDVLKAAFAEGRLGTEEYHDRVGRAQSAQTYGELAVLVQDLPVGPLPTPQAGPVPQAFAAPPGPLYGYPRPYPYAPYGGYPPPGWPPQVRRTNGAAVTSLLLGLAQVVTLGLTGVPALITGLVAKHQMRQNPQEGSGMATAGIVLGSIGTALWLLVIVLSAHAGH